MQLGKSVSTSDEQNKLKMQAALNEEVERLITTMRP